MRDLDIRGAGNMLGAEQSGFIEDVGFETYHKILDEAVQELRHEEFADVFVDQDTAPPPPEPTVDVEDDVFIPTTYVSNPVERLNLYRRLSDLDTREEIDGFRAELTDRFGPAPHEIDTLLRLAAMRPEAMRLRLPRVVWMNQRLFLTIPEPADDPYFHTRIFHALLEALNTSGTRYVMKESRSRKGILRGLKSLLAVLGPCKGFRLALEGLEHVV